MSDPTRRYDAPHGSSAFTGVPLPDQPLADRPTEVVHTGGYDPGPDATAPVQYQAPDDEPTRWEATDDQPPARDQDPDDGSRTQPDYRAAPVVVRRADTLAGLLLLLAGIAAGVSLLVVWVSGGGTGLDLVRDGFDDLGDPQRLADRDTWEPLVVVLGGAVLFLLGLLAFVPAKSHRVVGVLALLVSLAVAAAVLKPLADADWDLSSWEVGAWFPVAVAGLAFLGALKALATHPKLR